MFNNRFKTHLHILQLEGYSSIRFICWWCKHPLTSRTSQKLPLVYTWKAKTLQNLGLLVWGVLMLLLFIVFYRLNSSLTVRVTILFLPILLWWLVPFVFLLAALLLLKPYEIFNKWRTINRTREMILSRPLKVIAITGSFGKTTTKDFLAEILRTYQPTLKTPQSYNTIFGIAKVVDLELTIKVKYFVCEMGAYVRGEIKTLTYQVPPQYAILTGIGSQHLERFRTLTNTTLAKFELVDAVKPQNALVNLDNPYIREHLKLKKYQAVKTYGLKNPQADFNVSQYRFTDKGLVFSLKTAQKSYQFETALFGTTSLQNLTAAISMALLLGVPVENIQVAVSRLKPSPHRLELSQLNQAVLIDDAYSSNEQGFGQIMDDLAQTAGRKVLITPGIVELGKQTSVVHQQLGQKAAGVFDAVYLAGKSDRTLVMESALKTANSKVKVEYLEKASDLWPTIQKLSCEYDWILLENDLPGNY